MFKPNNILFGKLRPYLKKWLFPKFKGIALGDFWVLEAKNITPTFAYNLIQSKKFQKITNNTTGTKMPRSDWSRVVKSKLTVPKSREEQQKIGNAFKNLDATTALHQRNQKGLQNRGPPIKTINLYTFLYQTR